MKISIIRKEEQKTTAWSGGTTTQLAIYPLGAELQERDFLFRISTAHVVAESSTFTSLPGVRRVIMVLDGELDLEHVGHYSKHLKQFETDIFDGGWETRSHGKVTDFNLMTTGEVQGTIERDVVHKDAPISISLQNNKKFCGIYLLTGRISYQSGPAEGILEPGDFMLASGENPNESLKIWSLQACDLVKVMITIDTSGT